MAWKDNCPDAFPGCTEVIIVGGIMVGFILGSAFMGYMYGAW